MRKLAIGLICLLATGCNPKIGPYNVRHDSVSYNEAVKSGVDQQLLMNIVRLRYRDTPTFLEVGIVSASYDFKRSISAQIEYNTKDAINRVGFKPSFGVDYSEKPTTTYQPLRGKGFVDKLLSPIKFDTILLLNSSGWNVDRLMRCCVQRMNNVKNAPSASGPTPPQTPDYEEFLELADLFYQLERDDAIHFLKKKNKESEAPYYMIVVDPNAANLNVMNRIWMMLELDHGTYQFYLTRFAGKKHSGNEIAVETRSPLSLLYFLSHSVNVPITDQVNGRVTLTLDQDGEVFEWGNVLDGLMQIDSVSIKKKRQNCYQCGAVGICYRGAYFYIDDRDLNSKSTFSLISQLLALQTACPDLPVLTLPIIQ